MQYGRIYFTLTKFFDKLISYKKSGLYFFGRPLRNWKTAAYLQLDKVGTFQPDKVNFFYQHSQTLYDVMQEEIEISSLCVQ